MAKEIERKFLVATAGWKKLDLLKKRNIEQGYLLDASHLTIRIRVSDDEAWVTFKSPSDVMIERDEHEYSIPHADGKVLIKKAPAILKKTRSYVRDVKNQLWEVDQFKGLNKGLVLAEIELPSRRTHVEIPSWCGREVTDDPRYTNTYLINNKVPTE